MKLHDKEMGEIDMVDKGLLDQVGRYAKGGTRHPGGEST